nr:hypothetical protein [uncultured Rhodopila sp.]
MADDALLAKLIVTDTGPLITLAAADSLDYLLYPGVPVCVPDAVLYEATVGSDALGAQSIADWVQKHSKRVRPLMTQIFANYLADIDAGNLRRVRDLGERAALEAIRFGLDLDANERAVFVTEDDRVLRGAFILTVEDRARMIPMTTRDFLVGLEEAHRINSADEVYRIAEDAGRFASRRRVLVEQHQQARAAVERMLRGGTGT